MLMFRPASANTCPPQMPGRETRSDDPGLHCGLVWSAVLSVALFCSSAHAQLPVARLTSILPLGGKQGAEVAVTIHGTDLDGATGLRFSHPGITAKPKLAESKQSDTLPQTVPNQFT